MDLSNLFQGDQKFFFCYNSPMNIRKTLDAVAAERILILDGAMGSMIQTFHLSETDFRGGRFASHGTDFLGCNDLLCLTKPEIISEIHEAYLAAGADIIETCSFNSTSISLGDYGIADLSYEISRAAASLARQAADKYSTQDKPRFVAGSIGPTNKSASISPDINDPGKRSVTWDELEAAYYDNARGLLDGGADMLLIETIFDTLNAKAAIFAINRLLKERRTTGTSSTSHSVLSSFPLMISATVSDAAGRLLSGQTVEAFCVSMFHAQPWSMGLNCSFGAEKLKTHIKDIAKFAPCLISAYPNAGMPNQFGGYDETPASMAAFAEEYMREGLVNIIGGCCGSTPAHIAAIAAKASSYKPRIIPAKQGKTFLAGLEPLPVDWTLGFTDIGERTNVAGSRKFLRLIKEENYPAALGIAREMIERGAAIIDVCMDDALLDAKTTMTRFLNLVLSDPDIAKAPIMIDSSRWEVIETALKCIQGKGLVNSISLKEGEHEFLRRAHLARSYGAAVVIMLFDEQGQAASYERKIEVAERSYRLLTGSGFPPEDIVFDPNVLAVATGIPEHDRYALDFIRSCAWIREHCLGSQISGGISNLSFSFRGNDIVREAMHSVFLKHAIDAGLAMAIVNPAALISYDEIDPPLREVVEDVILYKSPKNSAGSESNPDSGGGNSAERLLTLALEIVEKEKSGVISGGKKNIPKAGDAASWRSLSLENRIIHAMIKGIDDYIETDVLELRPKYSRTLEIVEGPLMDGMREVGSRFGAGKMFLPQVIRSARVMKKAVAVLEPFMEQEKAALIGESGGNETQGGKVLLATVKGDVHDIGKNITGVVLGCNGYDILDLGVMVPSDTILEIAEKEGVQVIGLSGLITPSLDEMVHTAKQMEKRGLTIPLIIGGATTSLAHTALRIAPEYSGPVVYVPDASRSATVVRSLLSDTERPRFLEELESSYQEAVRRHESIQSHIELLPLESARKNRVPFAYIQDNSKTHPVFSMPLVCKTDSESGSEHILEFNDYPISRLIPYIDWTGFLRAWDLDKSSASAFILPKNQTGGKQAGSERKEAEQKLLEDVKKILDQVIAQKILHLRGVIGFFPALSDGDDILLFNWETNEPQKNEIARFSFLRNQEKKRAGGPNPCLADFILSRKTGNQQIQEKTRNPPLTDWIGLFALSAGFGLKEAEAEYKARHDDYGALLLGSLANCLTEALGEELHLRVRREFWAYEQTAPEEIFKGKYLGIRPAFGYPACPDHNDKRIAFKLLEAKERCGLELTESAMIIPAASICGMFFSSPSAYYFSVGAVGEDQIRDWAARKGINPKEAHKRVGRL
jgi:5-methyltetrahydrofolate--homocysteine methyltransferase